ncbi:2'-5' RNA ligase family protein [Phreatobacter sp. AB_2022a]|uniref:2'-5' RNA ligase family protein n=1 Tax=Phreatobacter sp. AB_2022a TaxID=3003134 RepID=UPI002286DEBA|nr:2'-5' RNA ligase family protein [Phreatobacter sp. AB_2022a]MCZ0734009.1 2'-5' RNA ligase family protein [Phreatobacter sp. AB_2022a]
MSPLQGELDLRLRPVARPERLFFAVMPDAAAARAIVRIGRTLCEADPAAPKLIRPERLHVSTHFVCDWPRLKARRVMAARLAGAAVRLPPFDLALRAAMTFEPFGSRSQAQRPLVLVGEAAGVRDLQAALAAAMGGRPPGPKRSGIPHVTLCYGAHPVVQRPIPPIAWTAREFVLLHSRQDRLHYDVLGRWPLGS